MTFEEWFNSGDPLIDRIVNCPDIMQQLKLTFDAAYAAGRKDGMEAAAGMISGIDKIAGPLLAAAIREAAK